MNELRTRPLTNEEWSVHKAFVARAFLMDPAPGDAKSIRELFPDGRYIGVTDGHRLLGGGGIQTREMTMVGAGPRPVAAVSYVGVRPDSRGRGTLRALMRAQLDELHATAAEPVAALWASMAPIYGRFGYGLASRAATLTVTGPGRYRPGAPVGGTVSWLDEDVAAPLLREVHARVAPTRVGWITREEPNWAWWLNEEDKGSATTYRRAVHRDADGRADGYAVFRSRPSWPAAGPDYTLAVHELVAATPEAHATLWRELLDLDMVTTVTSRIAALDDPVASLLVNPRGVLTDVRDGLWVRLVDLDRAVDGRRYAAPCELVLEVSDEFCPWNSGRWRLRVDDSGAGSLGATSAEPHLSCDITDLGAVYLGGTRLTALAAAGRVREHRAGAVVAASRA
ncbi:MAG TPA: GNAT family N-acetyltransferase, partial [Pseudonocardia sp.]